MSPLWLSVHLLGTTFWLGGLLTARLLAAAARREDPMGIGAVVRAQSNIYRLAVGPGAMASVLSGMILTLQLYGEATSVGLSRSLMTMQGLGLVAALLSLILSVPAASRLARLEPSGPAAELFASLSRRLDLTDWITLLLGSLAMIAGAWGRV